MVSRFTYGLVIFSSAFLLFQVQPILGKMILPWFGGAAGVWIVCLLFFQVVLLLGYFYAHLLTRKFRARTQIRVHAALLIASLLVLPILPKDILETFGYPPIRRSTSSGYWESRLACPTFFCPQPARFCKRGTPRRTPDAAPYRFYAVSNTGSMLALVSYPILMEPWIATSHQAVGWSWAYAAVALLCAVVALSSSRRDPIGGRPEGPPPPHWKVQTLWISLAACGSALLLAITHHISQNIASVPLLWVIPLALYLLTFILCFEGRAWYRRDFFLRLLGVALGSMAYCPGAIVRRPPSQRVDSSLLWLSLCMLHVLSWRVGPAEATPRAPDFVLLDVFPGRCDGGAFRRPGGSAAILRGL